MNNGTIKTLTDKGFGFITEEGREKDLFFHANEVEGDFDDFNQGDAVTFTVEDGPKGPSAIDVKKAEA